MKYKIIRNPRDGDAIKFVGVPSERWPDWPYAEGQQDNRVAFVEVPDSPESPNNPMFVDVGYRSFNLNKIVSFNAVTGAVKIWFDESAGGCNSTITPKEYKTLVGKMVEAGLWLD